MKFLLIQSDGIGKARKYADLEFGFGLNSFLSRIRIPSSNAHRILALLQLLCLGFLQSVAYSEAGSAQFGKVQPPNQIWLMLGSPTLEESPPQWNWIREQVHKQGLLKSIKSDPSRHISIIIPFFDDGMALFNTHAVPFMGRNPQAIQDEVAIHAFLKEASKRHIPVYFAFNTLGWQKFNSNEKESKNTRGIFTSFPEMEELKAGDMSPLMGTRFASPWSPQVRTALMDMVAEAAKNFPEVAGAVFDVHLSRGEIMGFGGQARSAARREINVDPVELNIKGTADEVLSSKAVRWMKWRENSLAQLATLLGNAWKNSSVNRNSEIWLEGDIEYGLVPRFDSLRSGQDWRDWLSRQSGWAGGLIEGRWTGKDSSRWTNLKEGPGHVIPLLYPHLEAINSTYGEEWCLLKAVGLPSVTETTAALVVTGNQARSEAVAFIEGRMQLPPRPPLRVNTIAPEVQLLTSVSTTWNFSAEIHNHSLLVFNRTTSEIQKQLTEINRSLELRGAKVICVVPKLQEPLPTLFTVGDPGQGWLSRCPQGSTLVAIDQAGFIRAVKATPKQVAELALSLADSTPVLVEGKPAPEFSMTDMNGQERTLSSLRGHKSLVLSFFPKCFTGGCANHMASLNHEIEQFKAADIEVWGVSVDAADVQRDFSSRWQLKFPLIPDTGRNLCFLYDAVSDPGALATRQTVFIDKNGIVRFIDHNVNVSTHGMDIIERLKNSSYIKPE